MDFTTILTIMAIIGQIGITRLWQAFTIIPLATITITANNFVAQPLHHNIFFWPLVLCWISVWFIWFEKRSLRLSNQKEKPTQYKDQKLKNISQQHVLKDTRKAEALKFQLSQHQPTASLKTEKPTSVYSRSELKEIEFSYQDFDGNVSLRKVVASNTDGIRIEGFCLLRQSSRTFRLDNILGALTIVSSGEVLDPHTWSDRFRLTL